MSIKNDMNEQSGPSDDSKSQRLPLVVYVTAAVCMGVALGGLGVAASMVFRQPASKIDIAAGAERLLLRGHGGGLSEPLSVILKDWKRFADASQPHPLVGRRAPNFTLMDSNDQSVELQASLAKGPVVLVFYYGYYCDHCVAQLFGLNKDLAYFKELGAQVLAVSADSSAITREKFAEYEKKGGRFQFPVLSDPQKKAAQLFGCFSPQAGDQGELELHGTFVIDQAGLVVWAHTGPSPYTNVRSLLGHLSLLKPPGRESQQSN